MGASGWVYFAPYQEDIYLALKNLQEKVFQDGDYYLRPQITYDPAHYADYPEVVRQQVAGWIEREKNYKKPVTIEELFEWNSDCGTHSILDIVKIGSAPEITAASPLPEEKLVEILGTNRPERKIVNEKANEIMLIPGIWEAVYFTVYKNNSTDEIAFIGVTGD
jgi:hypothetical protein